jgi:hypothetical protein
VQDITVLAVSNEAELAAWEAEIAADPFPDKHVDRLKRHVLTELMPFGSMANVQPVPTLSEEILVLSHRDGGAYIQLILISTAVSEDRIHILALT